MISPSGCPLRKMPIQRTLSTQGLSRSSIAPGTSTACTADNPITFKLSTGRWNSAADNRDRVTDRHSTFMARIALLVTSLLGLMTGLSSQLLAADPLRIGYSGLSPATAMLWIAREAKLF